MVTLVDTSDRTIGKAPKLEAHRMGLLHRAYSVLIFNSHGQLLLQQRAADKYHSPGLWTNTCCSHPLPGEDTGISATRRLTYEMGIVAHLVYRKAFIYRANVGGDLIEHEYDHIFTGCSNFNPVPNPKEAMAYRYAPVEKILDDMERNAEQYSAWFRIIFSRYYGDIIKWAK